MSGHSKWSTIKHKKGVLDAKRGKLFSQLSKNIRVAVKEGKSGDPTQNPTLRLALEKARAANMPGENIQRAIQRALGVGSGGRLEEIIYEGYGPLGIAFVVVVITDNRMRTASEIRNLFEKNGGSLGGPGSVMFQFQRTDQGYQSTMPVEIDDAHDQEKLEQFEEAIHNHEDVEEVYHNATFPDVSVAN